MKNRVRAGTTYHICIPVQKAIDMLMDKKKPFNPLNCSWGEALKILTDYRAAGIDYYTGCNREDEHGRCKGHPRYEQVDDATACTEKDTAVQ